jgi:hypothetical protein
MLRSPAAADRWTWILIACYAQLWLARGLVADIRLPWQRPQPRTAGSQVMTPGRVRAGFRGARQAAGTPASAAKPGRPGPGRPPGSKNKDRAPATPPARPSSNRTAATTRNASRQNEHEKASDKG